MTKKRRYVVCAAIFAACVCIALGVLAMMPHGPGVTKVNFDRIKKGMTFEEVETIFGTSPMAVTPPEFAIRDSEWLDHLDGPSASLCFENGALRDKSWNPSVETFTDRLRRWLHLPK
jgi:hypothetical protein